VPEAQEGSGCWVYGWRRCQICEAAGKLNGLKPFIGHAVLPCSFPFTQINIYFDRRRRLMYLMLVAYLFNIYDRNGARIHLADLRPEESGMRVKKEMPAQAPRNQAAERQDTRVVVRPRCAGRGARRIGKPRGCAGRM